MLQMVGVNGMPLVYHSSEGESCSISMNLIKRLTNPQRAQHSRGIIVVSGLPRSGTSMMMKALEAGGIPPLTDHERAADESNPKGYYEFERAKKLREGDMGWLEQARGKAVKVISALLEYLPTRYTYKIIFMQREMGEILSSQRRMLARSGQPDDKVSDEKMAELYEKHLHSVETWLSKQSNMEVFYVSYNTILAEPQNALRNVNNFLGGDLDLQAMVTAVDPDLNRERRGR